VQFVRILDVGRRIHAFQQGLAGFMLSNKALVVSGAFVGCSGVILTIVMCNAMNRSIANVLIGGFGEGSGGTKKEAKKAEGSVTQVSAEDVVDILTGSKSVIIVPGYEFLYVCSVHWRSRVLNRFAPGMEWQLQRRSIPWLHSPRGSVVVGSSAGSRSIPSPAACPDT
jgi:NAD(P) transhydrogenase beta subunit